ncbi:MAG: glycosyl transferase family 36, partial [Calditrichia bacterium]
TYFEWCLGAAPDHHREFHKTFLETRFDEQQHVLFAEKRLWEIPAKRGHWNTDWQNIAFFSCSESVDGFEGDKEKFIGHSRNLSNPIAVETGKLPGTQHKWNDSIASLKKIVELPAGSEQSIHFYLGAQPSRPQIYALLEKYRNPANINAAFRQVKEEWEAVLGTVTVETPDEALNFMTNYWLKYQAISGRMWGRAAYYQQSGAYGYRDQLQDSQVFLYSKPELTRKQLLLHAAHQFSDGRVLHWWHPITEQGLDGNMSDDLLWLPFVAIQYLKETGDWAALEEAVPFYDGPQPASLLEHCVRAVDRVLERFSERGLPLILAGDWNDGLSAVGLEGKGESLWLAHFLYYILPEFNIILNRLNLPTIADRYARKAELLRSAINQHGWDGKWFWRASKDSGELIGSRNNSEGKIYLNPQIWSVISGSSDLPRQQQAMLSVVEMLESDAGPLLLSPAYSAPDSYIGYLSRYAPGVRENGGVYTHAATWSIWAASKLKWPDIAYRFYQKICPINNAMNPDRYLAEPYVTPGNIDGRDSPHYGRGGWTWYTGSAAWLFRITIDHIIGIEAEYEGLRIKPTLPDHWNEIRVKRLFRGTTYLIHIAKKTKERPERADIFVSGEKLEGNLIPPVKNKSEVEVRVNLI